ncbi:hypothetical protein B0H10DRAFT_2237039 [Mycena sp. CBHHK59/15]|nr:hypothetical protein B0H10DRAFT_2237039 [Mycena sp. CBHHK59/15]
MRTSPATTPPPPVPKSGHMPMPPPAQYTRLPATGAPKHALPPPQPHHRLCPTAATHLRPTAATHPVLPPPYPCPPNLPADQLQAHPSAPCLHRSRAMCASPAATCQTPADSVHTPHHHPCLTAATHPTSPLSPPTQSTRLPATGAPMPHPAWTT